MLESGQIDLREQVAVITGAGRGLGAAYAKLFAALGAKVIVHDAGVDPLGHGHCESVADAIVNTIVHSGGEAIASYVMLGSRDSSHQLIAEAVSHYGRLDILVHNAGLVMFESIEQIDEKQFETMMNVHVNAPLWLLQAAVPVMRKRDYGRIVLTTSGRALHPSGAVPGLTLYGIGKMSQVGLMNAVAAELNKCNICVNAVSPVAATRVLRRAVEPGTHTPEQIAPGVAYLASTRCSHSGLILRAGDGRFSLVSPTTSEEFALPHEQLTPDAVAAGVEHLLRAI